MAKKILIMGLPDSGKTTLAKLLAPMFNAVLLNADEVRKEANDWDFSEMGRSIQANRMKRLADEAIQSNRNVVADFVCPTEHTREDFDADYIIWMDTIKESKYEDTNKMFEKPEHCHFEITNFDYQDIIKEIRDKL